MSADLTAERNLYKGKYRAMLKLINRTRNQLVQITDHIEDEGDRKYFGSTNHADWLRDLYDEMMTWIWDAVDETNRMKSDPYADIREQRARAESAEATLATKDEEIERLRKALERLHQASETAYTAAKSEDEKYHIAPVYELTMAFEEAAAALNGGGIGEDMSDLIERLRSNAQLPICPFDKRSPEYWTTPNDKPCKFCGGELEGPDKCTGADMRIMSEAADALATKEAEVDRLRKALEPFADECDNNISDSEDDADTYKSRFGKLTVGDFRRSVAALNGE